MAAESPDIGVLEPWTGGVLFVFKALTEELGAELAMSEWRLCSGFGGISYLPYEQRVTYGIGIRKCAPDLLAAGSNISTALEYMPLSCAVLEKSELRIKQLLSESKSNVLETAISGETPLHLAAGWARGAQLLLQAIDKHDLQKILEAKDCDGLTALSYAIFLQQADSIRLLVNAGACIDLENTLKIEMVRLFKWKSYVRNTDNIICLLSQILAERRRRLATIAFEWLPPDSLASFNLTAQQMPQEQAFDIAVALKNYPFSESWPHKARPGSIYHARCMSASMAEALYEAGFDRTDVDFHSFTPLMTVDFGSLGYARGFSGILDLINWFVSHGADINKIIPSHSCHSRSLRKTGSGRLVHRCAYWLGTRWPDLQNLRKTQQVFSPQPIAPWMQISGRSERDACECFCTGHGCSPVSLLTRGLWESLGPTASIDMLLPLDSEDNHHRLVSLIDWLSHGQVALRDFVTDVLRVVAFTALGMGHTCCVHHFELPPHCNVGQAILDGEFSPICLIDPDEVKELQEEDRYTAAQLDKFMVEVGEKLAESGQSYKEFFTGYFRTRLRKVLKEKEHLSPEDMQNIRDIGVVLDTCMESKSDSDLESGSDSDSEMQMN